MNISLFTYLQPFDTIVSIFLLFFIYSYSKFFFLNINKSNFTFFEIFNLSIIFLSIFLFVIINFQIDYVFLRPSILIILIILSIFFTIKTSDKNIIPKLNPEYYFFFLILFILSLSPPTDADSLDYHLGIPLEILKNGKLVFRQDWFHYYLLGYGEMINFFGLMLGSKNFGQLINFVAILNIFYVLSLFKKQFKSDLNIYYFLFSLPLILWFITSSKPQLYQSSLLLYSFYIILTSIKNNGFISTKNIIILSIFYCFCFYSKISFIFIISITNFLFLIFIDKKLLKKFIFFNFFIFLILSIPKLGTDLNIYGKFFYPYIEKYSSNPNLAIIQFLETLRTDNATFYSIPKEALVLLPFLNTLPFGSFGLSNVTGLLGVSFIFVYMAIYYLFKNSKENKSILIYIFFSIFITILVLGTFPNLQPRYLLEIYWLNLIFLFIFVKNKNLIFIINILNKFQSYIIILFSIISIFNLSIGSLNNDQFLKVMRKNAYNFNEAEWILSNIDKNKIVLSENQRSYIFLNNFLSREKYFKFYIDNQIDLIKDANYDYLVLYYPIKNKELENFVKKCTSFKDAKIQDFSVEARNFLSQIRNISYQLILLKKTC